LQLFDLHRSEEEDLDMKNPISPSRRDFLEFIGRTSLAASVLGSTSLLSACSPGAKRGSGKAADHGLPFTPIEPTSADTLVLASGFTAQRFLSWGDPINSKGETFGTNNDYLAFFRLNEAGTDGILWSNHESMLPLFVSGYDGKGKKTREQVIKEQQSVGGSLVRIRKNPSGSGWALVPNDPLNRRLSAETRIPLISPRPIAGSTTAVGTMANCAGGVTPWGTVLTCEENYDSFYGEAVIEADGRRTLRKSRRGWDEHFDYPPEHYGWVVEINPLTGDAKKLTALGRFRHEGATVRQAKDGRCVVYMGDDGENLCLYKFIADKPGSLEKGTLYAADLSQGKWLALSLKEQKKLQDPKLHFKDQTDVMIRAHTAAIALGATPLPRPEDIEIDPQTGAVYVALTATKVEGDEFGSLLKLEEKNDDPLALEFKSSTFISGGPESGFAYPDNLAFDRKGNLWMTTDIPGKLLNQGPYKSLGNNTLLYIPLSGPAAGQAFRVASAPVDAELTGPFFSPDGSTLFLAVQHPGEETKSLDKMTSHWPEGGKAVPKSSVVAISGPALDRLLEGPGVNPVIDLPVLKKS
jgi:uncharacterized protein